MENYEGTIDTVIDLIKSVEDEFDKAILAEKLIFQIAVWGTSNLYEALGLLEKVKMDYLETFYEVEGEDSDDLDE